jgi:hypothetical protein
VVVRYRRALSYGYGLHALLAALEMAGTGREVRPGVTAGIARS